MAAPRRQWGFRRQHLLSRNRGRAVEQRNWGSIASAVTALTAVAALLFTGLSLQQTRAQNQLAEAGQITDRFNAAVTNLASESETIRIGAIFALQRIMQDSPRDQPAAIQVLAAFIREKWPVPPTEQSNAPAAGASVVVIDLQAALTVLGNRNPAHDGGVVIDLNHTELSGADLTGAKLADVNLNGSDLSGAKLPGADLSHANLGGANFSDADLSCADLSGTELFNSDFSYADLTGADLSAADVGGIASLNGASFANLPWCDGTTSRYPQEKYQCLTG